jgi:hypothetical protein
LRVIHRLKEKVKDINRRGFPEKYIQNIWIIRNRKPRIAPGPVAKA